MIFLAKFLTYLYEGHSINKGIFRRGGYFTSEGHSMNKGLGGGEIFEGHSMNTGIFYWGEAILYLWVIQGIRDFFYWDGSILYLRAIQGIRGFFLLGLDYSIFEGHLKNKGFFIGVGLFYI